MLIKYLIVVSYSKFSFIIIKKNDHFLLVNLEKTICFWSKLLTKIKINHFKNKIY